MRTKLLVIMAVLIGSFCGIRASNACTPPPVAILTVEPDETVVGVTVVFDGSSSYTPEDDESIVKYEWDFDGDGTYDYTETDSNAPDGLFDGITTYAYSSRGDYTAKLRVTDNRGYTYNGTDTCPVHVNLLPQALLKASPQDAAIGADITFEGDDSNDPDGSIVKYEWDWTNDGTYDYAETDSNAPDGLFDGIATHSYDSNGIYTVKLRVTDNMGESGVDTCTVGIGYPIAILTAQPDDTFVDVSITFDGNDSDDPNPYGNITKYEWDWTNDGVYDYNEVPPCDGIETHTYSKGGTYIVKLRVTGGSTNLQSTDTCTVHITNRRSEPYNVSSNSVRNVDDILAYNWSGDPNIYKLDSVHNVVIENVIIDGSDLGLAAMFLQGSCSNITFRSCVIKNCNTGIRIGIQGTCVEKLNIEKCVFEKCYYGILFEKPAAQVSISDCNIADCNRPIVFQVAGGDVGDINNVVLDNIKIIGADADCNPINWVGVQHFKINNVTVLGGGVTDDQFALSGCQDGVVSNCHSEDGGNHGFAADYNSALDVYPQRLLFIGNTALNDANDGFYLSGIYSNDNKFVSNFSLGNTGSGIVIEKGVKNALLKNACRNNTNYGIHLGEDANDTIIMGNVLLGNGTNEPNYNPSMRTEVYHNIIGD